MGLGVASSAIALLGTSQSSLTVFPLTPGIQGQWGNDMTASTVLFDMSHSMSATGASTSAYTYSFWLGIYTLGNSSSLNLLNSVSVSIGSAGAATNKSTALHGARFVSVHSSQWSSQPVFKAGSRYFGAVMAQSAGQSHAASWFGQYANQTAQRSGTIGVSPSTNTSMGWTPWHGIFNAQTAAFPAGIGQSSLNKGISNAQFIPRLIFINDATAF